jgi:hypothetical protein
VRVTQTAATTASERTGARRRRAGVVGVAAVALSVLCAAPAVAASTGRTPSVPAGPGSRPDAPKPAAVGRAAHTAAVRLAGADVRHTVVPPHTTPSAWAAGGPGYAPGCAPLVDRHHSYRVNSTLGAAMAYLDTRFPDQTYRFDAGSASSGGGSGPQMTLVEGFGVDRPIPHEAHRPTANVLVYTLTSHGHGVVWMRVDGLVVPAGASCTPGD